MPFDLFDELKETIEKYSHDCIDKNNSVITNEECTKMLLHLQENILPKRRNKKTKRKDDNKK